MRRDPERRRETQREAARKYNRKNPQYQREWYLRTTYGITIADYDRMSANQGGRCAICGRLAKLVIDHDHENGALRSLLCDDCNVMLGRGKDCPEVFDAAARYLREYGSQSRP